MPSTRFDVLNAVYMLTGRSELPTADAVAAALATTRADVVPQMMSAVRAGLLDTVKGADGVTSFQLTRDGERALAADDE